MMWSCWSLLQRRRAHIVLTWEDIAPNNIYCFRSKNGRGRSPLARFKITRRSCANRVRKRYRRRGRLTMDTIFSMTSQPRLMVCKKDSKLNEDFQIKSPLKISQLRRRYITWAFLNPGDFWISKLDSCS